MAGEVGRAKKGPNKTERLSVLNLRKDYTGPEQGPKLWGGRSPMTAKKWGGLGPQAPPVPTALSLFGLKLHNCNQAIV